MAGTPSNETELQLVALPKDLHEQIANALTTLGEAADGVLVEGDEDLSSTAELMKQIRDVEAKIEDYYKPIKAEKLKAHRDVVAEEKAWLAQFVEMNAKIEAERHRYLEARRKAAELAQRQAIEHAEAIAKREREAEIARLKAAGDAELARRVEQEPAPAAYVIAPIPIPPPPKVAGVSEKVTYEVVSIDRNLLPKMFWCPDEAKIQSVVKAAGKDHAIPGVVVRESIKSRVTRTRRSDK